MDRVCLAEENSALYGNTNTRTKQKEKKETNGKPKKK